MEVGIFDSWRIISSSLIIKITDRSVFEYNMSGIPQETRTFWSIDDFISGSSKSIQLLCGNNKFEATLLMDVTGRTRIAWRSDFRDFLLNKYPYWKDFEQFKFPLLCFRNMSESQYEVSFEMNKF